MNHRLITSRITYIKKQDNRTFNNTNNIYKRINQYSTVINNNYEINKVSNVKK